MFLNQFLNPQEIKQLSCCIPTLQNGPSVCTSFQHLWRLTPSRKYYLVRMNNIQSNWLTQVYQLTAACFVVLISFQTSSSEGVRTPWCREHTSDLCMTMLSLRMKNDLNILLPPPQFHFPRHFTTNKLRVSCDKSPLNVDMNANRTQRVPEKETRRRHKTKMCRRDFLPERNKGTYTLRSSSGGLLWAANFNTFFQLYSPHTKWGRIFFAEFRPTPCRKRKGDSSSWKAKWQNILGYFITVQILPYLTLKIASASCVSFLFQDQTWTTVFAERVQESCRASQLFFFFSTRCSFFPAAYKSALIDVDWSKVMLSCKWLWPYFNLSLRYQRARVKRNGTH